VFDCRSTYAPLRALRTRRAHNVDANIGSSVLLENHLKTRGGLYSEGPAKVMDSQEPHLRALLGFIGITDVTFIRSEKLGFGPEHGEQALHSAQLQIEDVLNQPVVEAA
jgi:FMN-dependent NADH-azoreductase